jgi:16S rRNA (uracil1498-N3)-methyltransferase
MRLTRVYVDQALVAGKGVGLSEQAGLHLTRVLRLDAGARLTLFDGTGGEYAGTLERDGKKVWARVGEHDPVERESALDITLLQGVARGERMDLIVQKATELGIARIVTVLAERSVVKVDAKQRERKREHWQAVAIAACEQSGRNRVPEVSEPMPLAQACDALPMALLIGPEGGLADNERKFAMANGFVACRMGPRVMRTETAGLAALTVLQAIAGDFAA